MQKSLVYVFKLVLVGCTNSISEMKHLFSLFNIKVSNTKRKRLVNPSNLLARMMGQLMSMVGRGSCSVEVTKAGIHNAVGVIEAFICAWHVQVLVYFANPCFIHY